MNDKYLNLLVSASNIFGLIPLTKSILEGNYLEACAIGAMILASTLMHLSETKHNLPGFCLIKHSNKLLWIDRLCAYFMSLYSIYKIYHNPQILSFNFLLKGIIGLISMFTSENIFTNKIYFAISHSIWHYFAYDCLADVM